MKTRGCCCWRQRTCGCVTRSLPLIRPTHPSGSKLTLNHIPAVAVRCCRSCIRHLDAASSSRLATLFFALPCNIDTDLRLFPSAVSWGRRGMESTCAACACACDEEEKGRGKRSVTRIGIRRRKAMRGIMRNGLHHTSEIRLGVRRVSTGLGILIQRASDVGALKECAVS